MNNRLLKLQEFLVPPPSSDDGSATIAKPLTVAVLAVFIASLAITAWGVWQEGNLQGNDFLNLLFAILFGFLYLAARRGYLTIARYSLPVLVWVQLTYILFMEDGIRDVNTVGFALVLVFAGLFIGSRAVGVFGLLSIVSITAVFLAERVGWLQTLYLMPAELNDWGILSGFFLLITFLTYYTINFLERSAVQAKADAELLTKRNQKLSDMQQSLEARTRELSTLNLQLQHEITERQQAEQALQQNEGLTRTILDYMPDLILQIDENGTFVDYSPAHNMETLVPPEMFIGRKMTDVLPPEVAKPGIQAIREAIATNEMQFFEYALFVEDQEQIFESRNIPVGKNRVLTIVRDVTDERHAEQAALQTQKLESIGLLAGGIAHDFNNLLTGMLGQNSLALAKLPNGSPVRRHLEKSVASAKRASDLTRQLLAYAGKGRFLIEPIDINQLVQEGTSLLETVLPKQAALSLSLADALPTFEADRGQVQQIMMNLLINASESIEAQMGQVWIRTYVEHINTVEPTSDLFLPEPIKPGTYVCLEVNDTGHGMSQHDQERIFDPYYSTKGQGRGLGLSATLGIIRSYNGYLRLYSVIGQGTRFQVYFPASSAESDQEETAVSPIISHEGHVLIIDDEVAVQQAAREILELHGFQVYSATNGLDGLELFKAHQAELDLILLDMHMPVMDGAETLVTLRKIDQEIPVLVSSGYAEVTAAEILQGERVDFLQKPYDVAMLINKIELIWAKHYGKA